PAVLLARIGFAIGLSVMFVTVSVVVGFKREVRGKVTGFGSDIQLTNADAARSYETRPVVVDDSLLSRLSAYPEVKHVQRFSTKPGMIKTAEDFQGMVLKGVGPEFDPAFFRRHLLEGELPQFSDTASSNRVLISKSLATKLRLKLGDKIDTYYIQDEDRARRLLIAGIYQTNFSEYDHLFLLTDLYLVNRLNGWEQGQASGAELQVEDYSRLEETTFRIAADMDGMVDRYGEDYCVRSVEELNPQIFAWLDILDVNIWVILVLMIGVAGFTMVSGLLIIIIERTSMIGVLKSLGADNTTIRRVFLWFAVFLIGKGMLWGNAIGFAFYFVQKAFGVFKLDPETYYMDTVPVSFNLLLFFLLNAGTLLASVLMLMGPSYLITKIRPANSMKWE
ncbi:MAG: ABC transporter permease, partial [Bacteroides sp.]|nr:ABC transporter permease [Bacteroides sp.]